MARTPALLLLLPLLAAATADVAILHRKPESPSAAAASSPVDNILALAHNDAARLAFLTSKTMSSAGTPTVPVASGQQMLQNPTYIVRAAVGTPAQPLLLALDTSADAMWAPCTPCSTCPSSTLFTPAKSTSYSPLPCSSPVCSLFQSPPCPAQSPSGPDAAAAPLCSYTQPFADSGFTATLSQDSIQLGRDVIQGYSFGCVTSVNGPTTNLPKQGLLGLGRGPLSLLSQSGNLYNGIFSYCLPSYRSYYFSGSLRLGPAGQPRGLKYTPLLKNPHRPSLYYVNVTGISVGRVWVQVQPGSFAFDPATGAGTIIDSGTVISRFTEPVYGAIRDEFRKQVGAASGYSSLGAFDTCFDTNEVGSSAPAVTLHMDGVDLTLPTENTLIHSSATSLACLAMAAAPANVNSVVNVIANLQQQNVRVFVDVAGGRVGFAREACN